jgi:putative NADH-flavin reductase
MSIALLGATGNIGREILAEALRRGHAVTALVRNLARLEARQGLSIVQANAYDEDEIASAAVGHDVFISAFSPTRIGRPHEDTARLVERAHGAIIHAARRAAVDRFIVVGGVGSLKTASGVDVVDSPEYPAAHRPQTLVNREILRGLIADQTSFRWTYVSPPRRIVAGERTGSFRLALDKLLLDEKGESRISEADFAIAILDEVEGPNHIRKRFTVAY